ncbi:MAG TPA: Calx-beta domain-containing protein, partial [Vicinamibacterales bacterium]|nr:Calx-beta domain-containing protein [Vicinamibacterales bacterium]
MAFASQRPTGLASLLRACARFSTVMLLLASAAAWGQARPLAPFFTAAPSTAPSAMGAIARGVQSSAVPVKFNAVAMRALQYQDEVELTLPGAGTHTVVFELAQDHGGGVFSWVGYVKELGTHGRVILATGPGGSYGSIDTPSGTYRIVPGGDHDWLVDMSREDLYLPIPNPLEDGIVPEHQEKREVDLSKATLMAAIPGVNSVGLSKATPSPQAVIDLMVVVTTGLATKLGATLPTRLAFLVTRANTAYADSEIAITLRLVNSTVVNFADNTSDGVALNSITPTASGFNSAVFGSIESIRSQYGADLVTLLRDGSNFGGSGVAWVPSPTSTGFLYSTIHGCVAGCESVQIHEWGHNMGNHHDRATSAWQDDGVAPPAGPGSIAYGYAFCKSGALSCNPNLAPSAGGCASGSQPECSASDGSNFRDIMAYFHGTAFQLYKFSNPNVTCVSTASGADGVARPCGISETASNAANTALSMNNARVALSAARATVAGPTLPGSVQFTANSFSAAESAGSVTFTVSRANGSGGALSVNYTITAGSATAGVDYTGSNGTLTWADGDTANKSFTVTINNDSITEGNESFTVTLSNPTGAAGAYLGYPNTATGLIMEPWPPAGTIPGGFNPPSTGSSVAWATASDFSVDGDNVSLKSGAINFSVKNCSSSGGTAIPCPSILEYTGTFNAGTVSFSYQVNSYPSNGFFEFLVDGNVVMSDSGAPSSKFFSTAVTAGNHTLQWRYR